MSRKVSWDDVPDSNLLQQGLYRMEVELLEEAASASGKLMFKATFRVADGPVTGAPLFENFVIGSNDDPTAQDPATWKASFGARRLKRLFKSCGLPLVDDVDDMVTAAIGQHFTAAVGQETEAAVDRQGAPNKYAGRVRNTIIAMYPVGEKAEGPTPVAEEPAAPRAVLRPAAPGAAATAPKASMVKCQVCGESVTRAAYMGHMDAKHGDQE